MSRQINQKKEAFFGVRRSIQVGGHCRAVCGVISIRTALALKSGRNRSNRGFNICKPGRPFFELFTQTIYAAVIRPVSAYGNSDGKDSLYGSDETFAPRPGFNGLKKRRHNSSRIRFQLHRLHRRTAAEPPEPYPYLHSRPDARTQAQAGQRRTMSVPTF